MRETWAEQIRSGALAEPNEAVPHPAYGWSRRELVEAGGTQPTSLSSAASGPNLCLLVGAIAGLAATIGPPLAILYWLLRTI